MYLTLSTFSLLSSGLTSGALERIATPTSACFRAPTSLVPSPHITHTWPVKRSGFRIILLEVTEKTQRLGGSTLTSVLRHQLWFINESLNHNQLLPWDLRVVMTNSFCFGVTRANTFTFWHILSNIVRDFVSWILRQWDTPCKKWVSKYSKWCSKNIKSIKWGSGAGGLKGDCVDQINIPGQ